MSGTIRGKIIVFLDDAIRGGGDDTQPGVLCRFLAEGLPVPGGWMEIVPDSTRLNQRIDDLIEKLKKQGFHPESRLEPVHCDAEFVVSNVGGRATIRCSRDWGHEGNHAFRWEQS